MSVKMERSAVEADLTRIVQDVFQTMLRTEVEARDMRVEDLGPPVVSASMHLGGNWNGAVLMQCHLSTACAFAAAMTGMAQPRTADDDVKDVMGELINMVAGNFKGLLGGAYLSMPTVVEGQDYRLRILRGKQTARVCFQTAEGPVVLTVVELGETQGS